MSQPPPGQPNAQYNNAGPPPNRPPQGGASGGRGGYNNRRPMGAWQPAAPTSMQMGTQQQQGVPQGPTPQQQQQQQQQQQYAVQQQRGAYGVPPQMNPYGYNPYAQQYPVRGYNQGFIPGTQMYGAPNPNMYYAQQQQQQQQRPLPGNSQAPKSQMIPGASPGVGGSSSAAVVTPAPRPKKALVITDKDGKPIDLSDVKKKTSSSSAPVAPSTKVNDSSDTTKPSTATSSESAGEKMRQAVLERLQGSKPAQKTTATTATTQAPSKTTTAATTTTTPKTEEASTKVDKNTTQKSAAPTAKPETVTEKKPKSSLSAMLSRQEEKVAAEKLEEPAAPPATITPSPSMTDDAKAPSVAPAAPTSTSSSGKKRFMYSKEEMLRLKSLPVCMNRPDDLPETLILKIPVRGGSERRTSRGDGGGGNSWQRGAAPPRRAATEKQGPGSGGGGGGQWARGKAPPPKQQGRGGRGGRGGGRDNGPPFFDGPVAPLVKSKNGWRPQKSTSAKEAAEKKVKAILNKMTKEKFDRLASQMCEIPVLSYEILQVMISNVYEKAIDEPSFGDMYGDLCVRLSQQVQTDSFVHIIKSDEEPPTDDGESNPEAPGDQSSNNLVYRWSNDVSTGDAEVVGPFSSVEECFEIALSDTEQDRVERGEMELELVHLEIKAGMFMKVLKKKTTEEAEDGEEEEFYTVYFPVANHEECGQQLSKIFLSERECASDAMKSNSFKRTLLNQCEDEFNKEDIYVDFKKEKAEYENTKSKLTDAERAEREEELEFRRIKIKKQMLGNIKFIGQLYKKNLLKEKIMKYCISSLLKLKPDDENAKVLTYHDAGDADMDEEDHEAICNMFGTIGSTIDKPAGAAFMKVCFDKIKRLSTSKDLPSRSRFMYKDLLDLRSNKWIPRRKTENAKTIEEIRKDFEREERQKAQQSQQMNANYRGGRDYGRNDNRRGGRGSDDHRTNNRSNNFGGGSRRQSSKPVIETDDDGFTTIKGGKSSLAKAASSNAPKQQSAPKIATKQAFAALVDDSSTPSNAKATHKPLSDEVFERRCRTIRSEFMQDPSDMENLFLSIEELSGTPDYGIKFVQKNCDFIIDCKAPERESVYSLHSLLVKEGKLSSNDIKAGMVDFIEFIDSYVYDAPLVFDYLGDLLSYMIKVDAVDIAWICGEVEKTKMASEENPGKVMRALVSSMKKIIGEDKARDILDSSTQSLVTLLGPEKWNEIKGLM